MLLTGGKKDNVDVTRVTEYSETGFVRDLPELQQGRNDHGCSYFENAEGTKVVIDVRKTNLILVVARLTHPLIYSVSLL